MSLGQTDPRKAKIAEILRLAQALKAKRSGVSEGKSAGGFFRDVVYEGQIKPTVEQLQSGAERTIKALQSMGQTTPDRFPADVGNALLGVGQALGAPINILNPVIEAESQAARTIPVIGQYLDLKRHLENLARAGGVVGEAAGKALELSPPSVQAAQEVGEMVGGSAPFIAAGVGARAGRGGAVSPRPSVPETPRITETIPEAAKAPLRPHGEPRQPLPRGAVGKRWTPDPGAMPGEPIQYLDTKGGDIKTAKAAILEKESGPNFVYEVVDEGGNSWGIFDTAEDAARAAEIRAKAPRKVTTAKPTSGVGPITTQQGVQRLIGLRDKVNSGRYKGRIQDITEAELMAPKTGLTFSLDPGTGKFSVKSAEGKTVRKQPDVRMNEAAPNPTLLEEIPPNVRSRITDILDEVGSDIHIEGLTRPQIASAVKDIKIDAGKEASLRAQMLIDELLRAENEGIIGVVAESVPGIGKDVRGVNVNDLLEKKYEREGIAGEPLSFEKTAAGEQGSFAQLEQAKTPPRPPSGLSYEQQVAGTMFEKPKPPAPPQEEISFGAGMGQPIERAARVGILKARKMLQQAKEAGIVPEGPASKQLEYLGVEIGTLPRTFLASWDMSMPFRQGVVQVFSHPQVAATNFATMHRAFFSEKVAKGVWDEITNDPNYGVANFARLDLIDPYKEAKSLLGREEQFISELAERVPVAGLGVKAAKRAAYTFLNKMRMDAFNMGLKEIKTTIDRAVIDDPVVEKVRQAINAAKPKRVETEQLYKREIGRRFGKIAKIRKSPAGEATARKALGALKGELPKAELESIFDKVTTEERNYLYDKVTTSGIKEGEAATAYGALNKIFAKDGVEVLQRSEMDVLGKVFGNDFVLSLEDPGMVKSLARWVNISTGRGSFGRLTAHAPTMNLAFFAPRLVASRFQMINPLTYSKLPAPVRKIAAKDMLKFTSSVGALLALAKAGGANVETDPRSSDFAKIRIGNTRYDLLGGEQQIIRFVSQLATEQRKTQSGQKIEANRLETVGRFARSKLNPTASLLVDYLQRKNFIGEPFEWESQGFERFVPLFVQDIRDAVKEHGAIGGPLAIPSAYGVGVSTYKPKPSKMPGLP